MLSMAADSPGPLPLYISLTSRSSALEFALPLESALAKYKKRTVMPRNQCLPLPPPLAAFSRQTDRNWCINTPNSLLREVNCEVCVPHCHLSFPSRITFQQPILRMCLMMYPLLAFPPFLSHFSTPLPVFPRIIPKKSVCFQMFVLGFSFRGPKLKQQKIFI